jgi:hypothetical protein
MKQSSAVLLTTVLLLALLSTPIRSAAPPLVFQDCYCRASDGSCSVSISCAGGCQKACHPNGDCEAWCSGSMEIFGAEITLEVSDGTYSELTSKLAKISGKEIIFATASADRGRPDEIINVGMKRSPLWDGLQYLADRGTVRVNGKDFESYIRLRQALLSGQRFNFGVKNTPVNTFVTDVAGLTGLPLRITSGRPMSIANLELNDVTLDEFIARVSEQTGTRIGEAKDDQF